MAQRFRPLGKSAALPDSYHLDAIASYREVMGDPESLFFVVVTDDSQYAGELLSSVTNKIICSNSMPVDFSLMSLCSGGILSASSFSYWGAMLAMREIPSAMTFYAPKYWLGFRSKECFPSSIAHARFEYVEVDANL